MSLERYFNNFDLNEGISVPDMLSVATSKLDDEGRYMIRVEVPRKNLPNHDLFYFIENNRYRVKLNDEERDVGVFSAVLAIRIWHIYLSSIKNGRTRFFLYDSWEREEEEIECVIPWNEN